MKLYWFLTDAELSNLIFCLPHRLNYSLQRPTGRWIKIDEYKAQWFWSLCGLLHRSFLERKDWMTRPKRGQCGSNNITGSRFSLLSQVVGRMAQFDSCISSKPFRAWLYFRHVDPVKRIQRQPLKTCTFEPCQLFTISFKPGDGTDS